MGLDGVSPQGREDAEQRLRALQPGGWPGLMELAALICLQAWRGVVGLSVAPVGGEGFPAGRGVPT